jgi:hypothetical protein
MKRLIIFFACSFLFLHNVTAQDGAKTVEPKPRHAPTVRISFSETQSMRVPLMDIRDSSIYVYEKTSAYRSPTHRTNIYNESDWSSYNYSHIQSIKVRNKKLRAWLIPVSVVAGVVAGALIAKSSIHYRGESFSDDYGYYFGGGMINDAAKIFMGGLIGGAVGTLAGFAISSSLEKQYMINGDWQSFEEMKKSMNY